MVRGKGTGPGPPFEGAKDSPLPLDLLSGAPSLPLSLESGLALLAASRSLGNSPPLACLVLALLNMIFGCPSAPGLESLLILIGMIGAVGVPGLLSRPLGSKPGASTLWRARWAGRRGEGGTSSVGLDGPEPITATLRGELRAVGVSERGERDIGGGEARGGEDDRPMMSCEGRLIRIGGLRGGEDAAER